MMEGACNDCDFGFYKNVEGNGACTKCSDATTTLGRGSTKATDCRKFDCTEM